MLQRKIRTLEIPQFCKAFQLQHQKCPELQSSYREEAALVCCSGTLKINIYLKAYASVSQSSVYQLHRSIHPQEICLYLKVQVAKRQKQGYGTKKRPVRGQ